jgi:hypothetical protein
MRLALIGVLSVLFVLGDPAMTRISGDADPGSEAGGSVVAVVDPECRECVSFGGGTHYFTTIQCFYGEGFSCFQCRDEACDEEVSELGSCPQHHGWCAMTAPEIGALEDALEADDAASIARLLSESGKGARVNEERSVVQLFDCQGNVRGQFPVTSTLLRDLTIHVDR